ncbi:hypothetical protein OPV22_027424 [Ensete ventricosum]|uniref:Uncharacterized protein n=1 Tax=Ensete ventricosum TaxID=4639 RepID=A0AAV8PVM2_ENSVE|nr:hypothetical protein OPV22_027424 [Ensete ventricosum]
MASCCVERAIPLLLVFFLFLLAPVLQARLVLHLGMDAVGVSNADPLHHVLPSRSSPPSSPSRSGLGANHSVINPMLESTPSPGVGH